MLQCPLCHEEFADDGYATINWVDARTGEPRPRRERVMNPEAPCCRWCYTGGRLLEHNMRGVIEVLRVATGTDWHAENTGGNCMVLATYFGRYDEDPPRITIGDGDDGPLSCEDTVDTITNWGVVLSMNEDEWMYGSGPLNEIAGLEELPHLVRRAAAIARGETCPST